MGMNDLPRGIVAGELDVAMEFVDEDFFPPTSSDLITQLVGEYQATRKRIEELSKICTSNEYSPAVGYFLEGASTRENRIGHVGVMSFFALKGAIFVLNSTYWRKALSLTDVYDCMPQARRTEWEEQLTGESRGSGYGASRKEIPPLPDFEEEVVRNTLKDLLASRARFLAERVDGIFRGLSGEHVTNAPEAFGKRMIMSYVLQYGSVRCEKAGLINDLRCVIAKFMGRDEPKAHASERAIRQIAHRTGEWVSMDAGALKIRVYKKGTAHLEVHPDMAWRLNSVLANLYPLAIPAQFREQPKRKPKQFAMILRPLPFATLDLLARGDISRRGGDREKEYGFPFGSQESVTTFKDACNVLTALGGRPSEGDRRIWVFDYPFRDVLNEVIVSGCLPDQHAHQFYPTLKDRLGDQVVELADIGEEDEVLEPSAGQGHLAELLPVERTTCVEISSLNCAILRAKGLKTTEGDFLVWAAQQEGRQIFTRVVMNPPFSEGRAGLHAEAAASLLKVGGVLVAVLPASMRNSEFLGNSFACEWTGVLEDRFPGTSVRVVILKATRL